MDTGKDDGALWWQCEHVQEGVRKWTKKSVEGLLKELLREVHSVL